MTCEVCVSHALPDRILITAVKGQIAFRTIGTHGWLTTQSLQCPDRKLIYSHSSFSSIISPLSRNIHPGVGHTTFHILFYSVDSFPNH